MANPDYTLDTKKYAEYRDKFPYGIPADLRKTNEEILVLRHVSVADRNIIDLGCGAGRLTIPLLRLGKRVCAIELSKCSLKTLLHILNVEKLRKGSVLPVCGLAQNIPVTDNWADCVLFVTVFQYIPAEDQNKVLSEIARCLRKGGKLIISTFCYDSLLLRGVHKLYPSKWKRDGVEYGTNGFKLPYHRFTRSEITQKLKECGFEITSYKTARNFPFSLLSTKLDFLIAGTGFTTLGCQQIISARKR